MAINFVVNDIVTVNTSYVATTLSALPETPSLNQVLEMTGYLGSDSATVTAVGTLVVSGQTLSYISLLPSNTASLVYNNGQGVTLYFAVEAQLNNTFEIASASVGSVLYVTCENNSGVTIPKNSVVRQTGFNTTTQQPQIALASASASATSVVMGIADTDILNGASGGVLIEGSYQGIDTSSFAAVGDIAYLSNTLGAVATSAGAVSSTVGRILAIGTNGSIFVRGILAAGAGGGATGATGIRGTTGVQGGTGIQGLGVTGLQGATGILGNQGLTGLLGLTGLQGTTGLNGGTGIQGLTGVLGQTGIRGTTGVGSGFDPAAATPITYATGLGAVPNLTGATDQELWIQGANTTTGKNLFLTGGSGNLDSNTAGYIRVFAGEDGSNPGRVELQAGNGTTNFNPGSVTIRSGDDSGHGHTGGFVSVVVGGSTTGTAGQLYIQLLGGSSPSTGAKFVIVDKDNVELFRVPFIGGLFISKLGTGINIKEGADATMGVATLVGGTVVVSTTAVTATSRIFLTHQNNSGTPGFVSVSARTASTSFTILSASATDTSDIGWVIIEPI